MEEKPDQIHLNNRSKAIRCLNCGNERLITDQWLKDVSRKLSTDSSNICESDITKYLDCFYCSRCKKKNAIFIDIRKQKEPPIPSVKRHVVVETNNKNKDYIKQRGKITNKKFSMKGKKKLNREANQKASLKKNLTEKQKRLDRAVAAFERKVDFDSDVTKERKQFDRGAYLAALERKKYREEHSGGIPEYEEGAPRSEFGTRKEYKSMRAWKLS